MKVEEVMRKRAESCSRDTDLAAAAMIMWRNDCGAVPVTEAAGGKVVGVITDRDICMAVATRHRRAEEIMVGDVVSEALHTVHPQQDVHAALEIMKSRRVRRLPVVDRAGSLQGMLSINDLVRVPSDVPGRSQRGLLAKDVLDTLQAITAPRAGTDAARTAIEAELQIG
jgi:CBS domain-containing protein